MSLLKWNPSYSVHVACCDEDHKRLIATVNALHDAMLDGRGAERAQSILDELGEYAQRHFTTEELLMEKTGYSEIDAHRAEHQAFLEKVKQFRGDIVAGKRCNSIQLAEFLSDWLTQHVAKTDRKYSAHLNAHGIF